MEFHSHFVADFDIGNVLTPSSDYLSGWNCGSEQGLIDVVERHLPASGTFLDIGANIGLTGLIVHKIKEDAHIIAVEAAPTMASVATANFAARGLQADVHNVAAGSHEGQAYFVEGGPYGHMVSHVEERSANVIAVPITTADKIAAGRSIDIIKIDVEGFEKTVIDGCTDIDAMHKPGYYIEFNLWTLMNYGRINPRDFLDYLYKDKFAHASYLLDGYWQEINHVSRDHIIWRGMTGHLDNIFVSNDPKKVMT